MAWSKCTTIQRPQAWAVAGTYRELVRWLPRRTGSKRRLVALAERRARGMGEPGLEAHGSRSAPIGIHPPSEIVLFISSLAENRWGSRFGADPHLSGTDGASHYRQDN